MPDIAALNASHGVTGRVRFETSALGGPVVVLDHPGGSATVALLGAQVLDWQPTGQTPVLWLSPAARLDAGRAVRGGVPVCWPWFGPAGEGKSGRAWPQHGFARTALWQVEATGESESGAWVRLSLIASDEFGSSWKGKAQVGLTVTAGEQLELTLATSNLASEPLQLTQALHAYFNVGDIADTRIEGLDGHVFHDAVALGPATAVSKSLNSQRGAITFDREIDRVYLENRGEVEIVDWHLRRRIAISKRGSGSTVVWNPWEAKAEALGDLGPEGWRHMVCVEAANTVYDPVIVPPRGAAELSAIYACRPL